MQYIFIYIYIYIYIKYLFFNSYTILFVWRKLKKKINVLNSSDHGACVFIQPKNEMKGKLSGGNGTDREEKVCFGRRGIIAFERTISSCKNFPQPTALFKNTFITYFL
jgi:hypothetical protein